MTEEEAGFDPSLKKKKKKKKTPFDLDAAMEGGSAAATNKENGDEEQENNEDDFDLDLKKKKKKKSALPDDDDDENADGEDIDLESFGKKKKKKKTKEALNLEDLEGALPEDDDDLDLESFGKKKKKKKRGGEMATEGDDKGDDNKENVLDSEGGDPAAGDGLDSNGVRSEEAQPWMDDDRDYTYDELLQRVFNIMKDKNPEMVAGEKKKFVMRPPEVVKVGTKKTAFVNFTEIAKMLHRQPRHLLQFLCAELGTTGAVDGNNQLIIKGKFQQKHIEHVLRRYIKEYVTCHTCRSPDTMLDKETRIFFLQCMQCNSRCSVQAIKTGFQAVTGKRSANRAKQ